MGPFPVRRQSMEPEVSMSVDSVAASQIAITQARVQSEVSLSVLKIAQDSARQVAGLVQQAVEAAAETLAPAPEVTPGRVDLYG